MEELAAMLTNAPLVLPAVTSMRTVQIQLVRFNVVATMAIQEMEHTVLTLMNAGQGLTIAINMRNVQTLLGHFSVNAMEGLLETEQLVKTSMSVLDQSIVTSTPIVQIHLDHLTALANPAIQAMVADVKVIFAEKLS